MPSFYIERQNLVEFLKSLSKEFSVYVPYKSGEENFGLTPFDPAQPNFIYNKYRTIEPLKSFLAHLLEKIATFPKATPVKKGKPKAFLGITSCELFGLKVQDYVFKEGNFTDPLYSWRRENSMLISCDCTAFKEVCFCLALEILPYPTEGFDLNLSPVSEGFVIEIGSSRGSELVRENQDIFREATEEELAKRRANREELIKKLNEHLQPKGIPSKEKLQEIIKKGYNSDIWAKEAEGCVECGACNFICDTCHCFLLSDRKFKDEFQRLRCWDSCQYPNFARVAAGANPLKTRPHRLRNRFIKKFDFFPQNLGVQACCGCGRCIEACPAKIDIREILAAL